MIVCTKTEKRRARGCGKKKGKERTKSCALSFSFAAPRGAEGAENASATARIFRFFCKTITKKSTFFRRFRHFYTLFIYFIIDLFIYVWYNFF